MNTACTHRQLMKFLDLLTQKGVTPKGFQLRISSGALADLFDPAATFENRVALRKALGLQAMPAEEGFAVTVDYSLSLEQMLKAANMVRITDRFSAEHPYTDEHVLNSFSVQQGVGAVKVRLAIVPCEDGMPKDEVLRFIESRDCRPANLAEMLALFAQHPRAWREFRDLSTSKANHDQLCALGTLVQTGGLDYYPTASFLDDDGTIITELSVGDFSYGGMIDSDCLLVALK